MTEPIVPPEVRAAIHAGHVTLGTIFCDFCGREHSGDFIGETPEDRHRGHRAWLVANKGWRTNEREDACWACNNGIRSCGGEYGEHPDGCHEDDYVMLGDGIAVLRGDVTRYRELWWRHEHEPSKVVDLEVVRP